jgi:uncharacterized protein YwgA
VYARCAHMPHSNVGRRQTGAAVELSPPGGTFPLVKPSALPLLLASERFAPESEFEPLDRVRLQKGVFLLEMRGQGAWKGLYGFVPWDWGPYSHDLARDVNRLVQRGLLEEERIEYRRYPRYRTTPDGEAIVTRLAAKLEPREREYIAKVRAYVTSRSFSQLLREVYAKFPKYAEASRFKA